ncbi:hypothetical protein H920_12481 [Fukomys damarensis]|uniref:Uncharacterized protein n=1 Tax=Fukomys damarensis TaxID=885580 RepID=A0A091D797_FUKDA|nr:hypothetical protein H920_12481 [Fukomys damarensis]
MKGVLQGAKAFVEGKSPSENGHRRSTEGISSGLHDASAQGPPSRAANDKEAERLTTLPVLIRAPRSWLSAAAKNPTLRAPRTDVNRVACGGDHMAHLRENGTGVKQISQCRTCPTKLAQDTVPPKAPSPGLHANLHAMLLPLPTKGYRTPHSLLNTSTKIPEA